MSQKQATCIVDLLPQHWADLESWVAARGGQTRSWDLALGDYGWAYTSAVPEIFKRVQEDLEEQYPGQSFPDPDEMTLEDKLRVCRAYADCISCSDNNSFDKDDAPGLLREIDDLLVPGATEAVADPAAET